MRPSGKRRVQQHEAGAGRRCQPADHPGEAGRRQEDGRSPSDDSEGLLTIELVSAAVRGREDRDLVGRQTANELVQIRLNATELGWEIVRDEEGAHGGGAEDAGGAGGEDAGAEDAGAASSAHASAKPQLRNQARPLKHANSSGFGDVDHDSVGGRWIQEKRNDAVLACRSAVELTVVAADGDVLGRHRSSS